MMGGNATAAVKAVSDEAREGMPAHVAIIMDGNGRWAALRGLPRVEGHRRGIEAIRRAVRSAGELGIRYLTLYSFSSENWRRPAQEVADLMGLLKRFVRHDLADLQANNVRVRVIGERASLQPDIRARASGSRGSDAAATPGSTWSSPSTTADGRRSPAPPARWPSRWRQALWRPPTSRWKSWRPSSTRRAFPIPTSSFAPPARSGSPTS